MNKVSFSAIFILLLLCACQRKPEQRERLISAHIEYATLLQMQDLEDGSTLCRILNPWDTSRILKEYKIDPQAPLKRNTLCASCHCYLMQELGALDNIAVVCDADYTQLSSIKERLSNGTYLDAGTAIAPNIEVILSAESDAIWISPFENAGLGQLSQLNIPIIYCADYMENTPLARAEWMKFYGRLVGKGHEADSLFEVVKANYLKGVKKKEERSRVEKDGARLLVDLPTSATWYVPGGRSTMGHLYQDAGFSYPWAADTHAGSLSLSPEVVLDKGWEADIWLFKYYSPERDWSTKDLAALNPAFASLKVMKEDNLWGCNTATSPYFDETPFRPDLLLASLRRIACPSDSLMLSDTTQVIPQYFKRL